MAARKPPARKKTAKSRTGTTSRKKATSGFTEEERDAMRERARELKRARAGADGKSEESAVLEKIASMAEPDRTMGERLHAIIRANTPELSPRLWYGMPAYARDGKVVCFFQGAQKFKTRYATLGFSDHAALDDGQMWPTSFALKRLSAAEEARIAVLLRKAVS